jgi:predicted nucleic acid-binding protein
MKEPVFIDSNIWLYSYIKEILTSFYSDYKVIYFSEAIMYNASEL